MKIVWELQAREDVAEVVSFIDLERPMGATALVEAIGAVVERLVDYPASARKGRARKTREAVVIGWPYIIVYMIAPDALRVLRVFHTSRRWPRSFQSET